MKKTLPPKYQRALELVLEGILSYKQIANKVGLSPHTLYSLVEGKENDSAGKIFYETLMDHEKKRDKEIRHLVKNNKKLCQRYINEYLGKILNKKGRGKEIAIMTTIANALAKSTPNVEIGSFHYQKGLSAEDIFHEFNRLTAAAFERRGLQTPHKGGAGEISDSPRPNRLAKEEPEDPILPTEPEA